MNLKLVLLLLSYAALSTHSPTYLLIHSSIHLPFHLFTHPSHSPIHPPTHLLTLLSISPNHPPICHPAIHPSIHPSAHLSTHPPTDPLIYSSTHPSTHLLTHSPTQPSTYSSVQKTFTEPPPCARQSFCLGGACRLVVGGRGESQKTIMLISKVISGSDKCYKQNKESDETGTDQGSGTCLDRML